MGKTILFDVDGTLLNTEVIYMRAWQQAGAKFGYTIPWEVLLQTRAINHDLAEQCMRRCCGEDFRMDTIRPERVRLAEREIADTPADQLLMPHVRQTLAWLKQRGYALAVASSTGREGTNSHLAHAQLLDQFDAVVGGDMVKHGKPAPDIFLLAAELAGARPEECLVVGDTPADVNSAFAAGIKMILIPDQVPANDHTRRHSWKVLDSLAQLPEAVQEWERALVGK